MNNVEDLFRSLKYPQSAKFNAATTGPEYVVDWPLIGINAQGAHLHINNVHIEGVGIGVNVVQSDGVSSVSISNVDGWLMHDADMAFTYDPAKSAIVAPTLARQAATCPAANSTLYSHYWKYSCTVLISHVAHAMFEPRKNGKDRVSITNVGALGGCKYILRDAMFEIEHSAYGHGQFPNSGVAGITLYVRGDCFSPSAGIAPIAISGAEYTSGSTAKRFFFGPIS